MRNPDRIDEFCKELANVWKSNCPDWRFFQLISNIHRFYNSDMFYTEDDEAINRIKKYFNMEN